MKSLLRALIFVLGLALLSSVRVDAAIDPTQLTWSVQYLVDVSQTVMGKNQASSLRDNRGLALSTDGRYLYAGYNNGGASPAHPKQIRKLDLTQADYTNATVAILEGNRGKSLAADDKGRVYMAEGSDIDTLDGAGIHIYNANLTTKLYSLPTGATYGLSKPEGIAVTREGGALVLYATDRNTKSLYRFVISEGAGDAITGVALAGLTGTGSMVIPGADNLRGVDVDPSGRIWMADGGVNLVFRINSDGTGLVSTGVSQPFDIAFDDSQVFVTQTTLRTIAVLAQSDLAFVSTITPPWNTLKLDPSGGGSAYLSGIVVADNSQLFIANEHGSTANNQSTYGPCDAQSNSPGGACTITDLTHYDKDPILTARVAPTALSLASFQAGAKKDAVQLRWQTATEMDLVGFRVWRTQGKQARRNMTPALIPAQNAGQINGAAYAWQDRPFKHGKTYTYQIQVVRANGASVWSELQRVKFK